MKLASLYIAGFLGIREASFDLSAPVTIVCGRNGAGKSSLRDALRLVLTADLSRVDAKKDAAQLITDGHDNAVVKAVTTDGEDYRVTITRAGKITDSQKGHDHDPRLPYVLDAQRTAKLTTAERRAFLFGVTGLQATHTAITERMLAKGLSEDRIKRIAPLLRAGFEPAAKDAKERASQSRGAWKTLTNENYGTVKAKTWSAAAPAFNNLELQESSTALADLDTRVAAAQQALGAIEADSVRVFEARARINALQGVADQLTRRREKLAHDRKELAHWQKFMADDEAAAGTGPRVGLVHDLARALHFVQATYIVDMGKYAATMAAYEAEHGPITKTDGDPDARARLPGNRSALRLTESAEANSVRDVRASELAEAEILLLKGQIADTKVDTSAVDKAREAIAALQTERRTLNATVTALRAARDAKASAGETTAKAAGAHADVVAWDAIADALSPEGIPSDMLTEAIGPFNARLAQAAADTGWPQVVVHPDMGITAAGRPYALLSESEQWRCDAMLAEAVTFVTGLNLLVLDRMDVLDAPGRAELLGWLDALATAGEVATVIVLATLKALPADLPDTMATHWIEAGRCGLPADEPAAELAAA